MRRGFAGLAVALLDACATAPDAPPAGRSGAWGYVRLVPREGVAVANAGAGAGAYGDRRLADVQLVDYSRPGFAVVYADGGEAPPARDARLEIVAADGRAQLAPAHVALGVGAALVVENRSEAAHVVSVPGGGVVQRLAPGEATRVAIASPGEWPVFLLDVPGEQAVAFAAPGRFAVASPAGRFELELAPGRTPLRVWHPRFPPASTSVTLAPGTSARVDFELRVDRRDEEAPGVP